MLLSRGSQARAAAIQESRWIELQAKENLHAVWKFYLHRTGPCPGARGACFPLSLPGPIWVGVCPVTERASRWVGTGSGESALSGLSELSFMTVIESIDILKGLIDW